MTIMPDSTRSWHDSLVDDDAGIARILQETRTIAVLGAKPDRAAPSYYVPAYLAQRGYRLSPINPEYAGQQILGEIVIARLAALPGPVDLVEVFRRPGYLVEHAREILALPWRPRTVWFQLGIRNDEAAAMLARGGITVVQDRCMMPDHMRLIGAA
jgi:predicted CoA-binding protein